MEVSWLEAESMEVMEAASKATIGNTMVAAMVVTMMTMTMAMAAMVTTTTLARLHCRAACSVMEAN
jgi:hypothetical protein